MSGGFARIGEWAEFKMVNASGTLGFTAENVLVEGRMYTDPDAIRAIVNIQKGDPLFALNPAEAKDMLEKLSWVKSAEVQRRLPDTLYIELEERQPLALWQRNKRVSLIDREGKILTEQKLKRFKDLVIVTGKAAETEAENLIKHLNAEPTIRARTEAAAFISERRWDVKLKDGKTIRLPEDDIGFALHRLAKLDEEEGILDRAILSIDLRQRDRISVQTSPNSVENYKASYTKKDGAI
ncbi:MAG: FtsQ-type POTRA domain-containing protein [Pseudomonadota bacterium]